MSSLPEFADLETLLCQGNFSADALLTPTVRALTAHSAGANQPFRSSASQPTQPVQKGRWHTTFGQQNRAVERHKGFTFRLR
jgi:hypothetical protein